MDDLLVSASHRRLRVFLVVCETLHMARAAERLGVAQPALSQQIRSLEQALGVRLFHRRKRGIDLTAAGHACRTEAERLIALHSGAMEIVRRIGRGEAGKVALGYVGSAMFEARFLAQLRTMRETYPDVELDLREGGISMLLSAVAAGEIDAALVRAPVTVERPLRRVTHSRQKLVVVLPEGHALADAPEVRFDQLAGEAMISFSDGSDVGLQRMVTDKAAAAGVDLAVGWRVSEVGSVLGMVGAGFGYSILPESVLLRTQAGLVGRRLAEAVWAELWLVWHEERETPALRRFLELIERSDRET
jgi:DNA-binding transcriptional LysR family regulator